LLEANGTQGFLDFGTSYAAHGRYFEEFLKPRDDQGILDHLVMGVLPPIEGLYRTDLTPPWAHVWDRLGDDAKRKIAPAGILLSHAHGDHASDIAYVRSVVPIHASLTTAVTLKALQDSGRGGLATETVAWAKRATTAAGDTLAVDQGESAHQRIFRVPHGSALSASVEEYWVEPRGKTGDLITHPIEESDELGSWKLSCLPVDHSILGSVAWGIETGEGLVLYTGDLRPPRAGADLRRHLRAGAGRNRRTSSRDRGRSAGELSGRGTKRVEARHRRLCAA